MGAWSFQLLNDQLLNNQRGVIPFVVGTTFLLGSWYGLLGLIIVVGIAFRAVREERVLRLELPGYEAYMARVKYRLIPYVW